MNRLMAVGGKVLARTLDDNRRSALHFAAALGKADLVRALVHNGADVDLGDKEGARYLFFRCFGGGFIIPEMRIWPPPLLPRAVSWVVAGA
jgi:hypothetical protein